MDQLSFYHSHSHPTYQPSYETEQAVKGLDDWLTTDTLNTPDINPDLFDNPMFDKLELKPTKIDLEEFAYLEQDLGVSKQMGMSVFDRSSTYSPYDKTDSASLINLNLSSPDNLMPCSPSNAKLLGQLDSNYLYEDTLPIEMVSTHGVYSQFYASPSGSTCNSRSSSISAGSAESVPYLAEYPIINSLGGVLDSSSSTTTNPASNTSVDLMRVAASPASICSAYSTESNNTKTFTNLDNVQSAASVTSLDQIVQVKQEPIDLYQPTVIAEYFSLDNGAIQQQQQQQSTTGTPTYTTLQQSPAQQQNSYATISTIDLLPATGAATTSTSAGGFTTFQYSTMNSLPSTVCTAITQQQQQQQPNVTTVPSVSSTPTTTSTSGTSHSTGGRKRNANAAFSNNSNTCGTASSSGQKKPRMTKREKQKMMESDITKFETENRDLRQSIHLLERQIAFCKRFLSENVAPVIQRQQQMQQTFSPAGSVVSEVAAI